VKSTLEQLKWAILGALLLACLGVTAALHGNTRQQEAARVFAMDDAAFRQSKQRLDSVYAERREIDDYLPRFTTLQSLGALGNENRLEWIERITSIRAELALPRLVYTIEPRQANQQLQQPVAGLAFETSRMKLDFALVHEGDLLRLIDRLRAPAMGIFELRSCTLSRSQAAMAAGGASTGAAFEGNLEGSCEFDWISLTGIARPEPGLPAVPGKSS
jgi:hypothetical protein